MSVCFTMAFPYVNRFTSRYCKYLVCPSAGGWYGKPSIVYGEVIFGHGYCDAYNDYWPILIVPTTYVYVYIYNMYTHTNTLTISMMVVLTIMNVMLMMIVMIPLIALKKTFTIHFLCLSYALRMLKWWFRSNMFWWNQGSMTQITLWVCESCSNHDWLVVQPPRPEKD